MYAHKTCDVSSYIITLMCYAGSLCLLAQSKPWTVLTSTLRVPEPSQMPMHLPPKGTVSSGQDQRP